MDAAKSCCRGRDLRDVDDWFVREVLPLERALEAYLRRNWRNSADVPDMRQDVYVRVYEAAERGLPRATEAFVFGVARNLLIDRMRRSQVIDIEAVAEMEKLPAADDFTPERISSGREELRKLQAALDRLPPRCRETVILRKLEGLSQREAAAKLGVAEDTVEKQTAHGVREMANYMLGAEKPTVRSSLTLKGRRRRLFP